MFKMIKKYKLKKNQYFEYLKKNENLEKYIYLFFRRK